MPGNQRQCVTSFVREPSANSFADSDDPQAAMMTLDAVQASLRSGLAALETRTEELAQRLPEPVVDTTVDQMAEPQHCQSASAGAATLDRGQQVTASGSRTTQATARKSTGGMYRPGARAAVAKEQVNSVNEQEKPSKHSQSRSNETKTKKKRGGK